MKLVILGLFLKAGLDESFVIAIVDLVDNSKYLALLVWLSFLLDALLVCDSSVELVQRSREDFVLGTIQVLVESRYANAGNVYN